MSRSFGRVGVLYGGQSAEREVSLMSGSGVCEALCSQGVDAHLFDTGERSLAQLADERFDRVFIALHGRYGEDGTMQGALELLGIPYTGSGPLASCLAMDKITTKRIWEQHGLDTPAFRALQADTDLDEVARALGLPLIIKPPHEGSTLGVTRVDDPDQLAQGYRLAAAYDDVVLAEQFIAGRELTVPLLGSGSATRALPVIEIVAPEGNYDYEHKYVSNETQYLCPAPLDETLAHRIMDISERAYLALGCEGWGRADFMLDGDGKPWLLEMNTTPGMTTHSLVPMGARAIGMSYAQLCLEILSTARCKVRRAERT
ncbi:MAG: D-alanine--D-alanine ligase [Alcaligenaceae bacterium]|nr:D-alanine--D-alanine ligase [Alcaligenaceae bacterium]